MPLRRSHAPVGVPDRGRHLIDDSHRPAPHHRLSRNHARPLPEWYHYLMALTLRTDEELEQALAALAESEGLSRQEVIRRAVLERYERTGHRARVEASADKLIDRWGDVLDRLGSV